MEGRCGTEQEVVQLKSALWAAGATGSSGPGLELVQAAGNALGAATRLAATAPVYSVRAAAFYVLALFGSTYAGANLLNEMGWLCVRHTRHDRFPIIKEENWISKMSTDDDIYKHLFTSPYKNLNVLLNLDMDTSETSERTDASIAESCHSDKSGGKHITTSALIQQSVVEENCDSNDNVEEKLDPTETDTRTSSESSDKVDKRLKSQTLPQRLYPGFKKHQRSLSESKTVDKLKTDEDTTDSTYEKPFSFQIGPISETRPLIGRMNSFEWQDGLRRIRNNSESSTSGVSSCDSVYGKYVINDRFLTLSPIPSSSSLSAMKGQPARHRPLDTQRRISLQSYTGSDAASSPPSHRDIIGYATLKSLTRHRRPHVSESAAGVSAMEELLVSGSRRSTFLSSSLRERTRATQERTSKLSLLKYDWKPLTWIDVGANDLLRESTDCTGSILGRSLPCSNLPGDGPCYRGVALPADLLRLFPRRSTGDVDFAEDAFFADTSFHATDGKFASTSRDSDRSFILRRAGGTAWWSWPDEVDGRRRHEPAGCLQCARHRPASAAELREAFFAGMESPNLGPQGAVTGSFMYTSLDVSCSPTSLESTLSKTSEGNCNISTEVLKHAERMGNPLWIKQSQQSLLSLKQKYPETFQSVCLYSEVCKLMSHGTYRVSARRFLQELFLDTSFECFYTEPMQIIQSRLSDFKPPLSE